jgi:hypothetical protein
MVHITLPIEVTMGNVPSTMEVLGIQLAYSETPLQLQTTLAQSLTKFRQIFQFREGVPQDTVNVQIRNSVLFIETLKTIFQANLFESNTSVPQLLSAHLSEMLVGELTKVLGLNAGRSLVNIVPTATFLNGVAEAVKQGFEHSEYLPQFLYEQYFKQSPDRFLPGKDDAWQPIPFETGDSLSFYLQLNFQQTYINGDPNLPLSNFLKSEEIPTLRCIIILNFGS